MAERLRLIRERIEAIPVLLARLARMGVQLRLDEYCPTHGTGVGLSLGGVTVGWLAPILSQAAQRLNHVEPGVEPQGHTWRRCPGQRVPPLDVSDDRLAAVLEAFRGLTLTIIQAGRRRRSHLTPLSTLQRRILVLLDFPVDISMRLCPDSHKPP